MANESFFGRMAALPGKRLDDFLEQTNRYQRGEIGVLDQMLQGGANAVGMFTDIPLQAVGEAISAVGSLSPDFIQKGLQDLSEGIMETEAAKAAMKYAEENPQNMKRLGYIADLSVVPAAKTSKTMLQDLSLEAANRQPWFYGSGKGGQAASIVATAPSSVVRALSPSAAAYRREGLPQAVRTEAANIDRDKYLEAKQNITAPVDDKRRRKAKEILSREEEPQNSLTREIERKFIEDFNKDVPLQETIDNYNKDLGFLVGQLDQTQLLNRGRDVTSKGVVGEFEKVQQLAGGVLDKNTFGKASSFSKDVTVNNIKPNNENLAVIEERVRKAWKINPTETVEVVIRDPKAFTDLGGEITSKSGVGSKEAKRIIHARNALNKHFPEKTSFTDEELMEFVLLTRLPDDTVYNIAKTNEIKRQIKAKPKDQRTPEEAAFLKQKYKVPINRVEEQLYKFTELKRYGRIKDLDDSKTIDKYYELKKLAMSGTKMRPASEEIFAKWTARMDQMKENVDVRGNTIYFSGSHKSATKGLGGVNNQFMVNKKGDFLGFITDESDLVGMRVPGDKRVLTVVPPAGFNVFKMSPSTEPLAAPQKQRFVDELSETYGAEPRGTTKKGMLEQTAEAIQNQPRPDLQASDFKNLASAGVLTAGASRER